MSVVFGIVLVLCAVEVRAAYEGQIVDAETKEPIEGVVVFMKWSYLEFSLMPHAHKFADAYETLTDSEGRFSLRRFWSFNPWKLAFAANLLTIFKSGYEPVGRGSWGALLQYEWGAKEGSIIWKVEGGDPVILLKKVSDMEQRKKNMSRVDYRLTKDNLLLGEINKDRQILGFDPIPTK